MRIAVTFEDEEIFQHFGHTEQFKVYDIEEGKITQKTVVNTNGSGHGALADILKKMHTEVLICGGIGGGAQRALSEAGINLYGGVQGKCDDAVDAFLAGKLHFNPDIKCEHHGEHHHGEDHTCGEHGCGSHNCGNH